MAAPAESAAAAGAEEPPPPEATAFAPAGEDGSLVMRKGEAEEAKDFAQYFCAYQELYHQQQMLQDHVRMRAYHSAILHNKDLFKGKVVMDVGTGSGILAIWAAQAGAAKVYAIEYTQMARHAAKLVERNNVQHIVDVRQTSLEDLDIGGEKVDIIISEWMGYFLLRESMLDTLVRARDRHLAPGGLMFPSHATMVWSTITNEQDREQRHSEYASAMGDWSKFTRETLRFYNVDMGVLEEVYEREQRTYHVESALWTELRPEHVVSIPVPVKHLDLHTCTLDDVRDVGSTPFEFNIPSPVTVSGFAGWFTVDFRGTADTPCPYPVHLSTGPEAGSTHWGQQCLYLLEPVECESDTRIAGTVRLVRQEKNQRLYNIAFEFAVNDGEAKQMVYEMP